MFVGFLQQPGGGPCFMGNWDPDELSSLHSSPSPIHRQPYSVNASPADPPHSDEEVDNREPLVPGEPELGPLRRTVEWCHGGIPSEAAAATQFCDPALGGAAQPAEKPLKLSNPRERRASSPDSCLSSPERNQKRERKSGPACADGESRAKTHNNNNEKSTAQARK